MFYIINKDKIISYVIAIVTVLSLFLLANTFKPNMNAIETGAKLSKELPIYKVNTEEKKVALTINCAWNDEDIDLVLETLKKHNVKTTFFVVGEWAGRYRRISKENK